ncbi:uncharacterized protein LOC125942316 [Dermacentor silvarum]|uniref:uncharacterized protein LOC125942316 n=1 Tax=Dermacentor silvarum TaxID=543639 RepID=UPI002101BA24|nr:uncharacterized protein LOC125942316 [Dermacentor silvarum]
MVPCHTGDQCREHYKNNFAQRFVSDPYTPDEDYSLLELGQKHVAGHWSKVEQEMPWRTANLALMRYRWLTETLGTKQPTVADLVERSLPAPAAHVNAARRARLTGLDKRLDLYRRVCRHLTTQRLKRAALLLAKCCTICMTCQGHLCIPTLRKWAPCPPSKSSSARRCLACQTDSSPTQAASCRPCCHPMRPQWLPLGNFQIVKPMATSLIPCQHCRIAHNFLSSQQLLMQTALRTYAALSARPGAFWKMTSCLSATELCSSPAVGVRSCEPPEGTMRCC